MSTWENNDRDVMRWLRTAYSATKNDTDTTTMDAISNIIISSYCSPGPIKDMSMSQVIDAVIGILYYFFCNLKQNRTYDDVEVFVDVIEALRNRSFILATWNLPVDEIDCDEFKQDVFRPVKTDHVLFLDDNKGGFDSDDDDNGIEDQSLLKLKTAITNTRLRLQEEMDRRANQQLVASTFSFATMMTYYFKDIDEGLEMIKETESYAEYPFDKCDFDNLRRFLYAKFKASPKIALTAQAWIYKIWMMSSFLKSTEIRTRQPQVTFENTMTFLFNAAETNMTMPTNVDEMMTKNKRLYSDCLLNAYSSECPSGDFIGTLMTKQKKYGLSIEYIQIAGMWVLRDSKKTFKCPSLCHAFFLARITMLNTNNGKMKNRIIKFNRNDYKLFNIPETVDFDVLDEYLPLDI